MQKKGVVADRDTRSPERKRAIKPSNGVIVINSMLARLELFNEAVIQGKDMSMEVKLGKQIQQSTVLEKPGKELIIIDTFVFKRTWEETIKIAIKVHDGTEHLPTYFVDINLRDLFDLGKYTSKKVKIRDENKNFCGELIVDMYYKVEDGQQQRSLSMSMATPSEMPEEHAEELKNQARRQMIEDRIKRRQEEKQRSKELASMSTLAVLQDNDIILPPLKSVSRMATLSPKNKHTHFELFNSNNAIKFSKSPRFATPKYEGYDPYAYVRESDFDDKQKKRGTSMGYGNKYDFVKPLKPNPGVGRYEIPSVWNKYK